jgi:hypothetical protein
MSHVPAALAAEIRSRAKGRCEYCRIPEAIVYMPFEIEHVRPRKHQGQTNASNLALACFYCNRHKGTNVAGMMPDGIDVVRLFHPRIDVWDEHFGFSDGVIFHRTEIGRATIDVLRMNEPEAIKHRQRAAVLRLL